MAEEKKSREIDIIALGLRVLKEWKTLSCFVGIFAVIGVIVAISTPKEYTSEVILAPEMSSGVSLSGSLADIASNFGVDIGNKTSMDAIYPELYPDIFSSTDFVLGLFNVPVRLKDDSKPRTYLEHMLHDSKTPFWQYPQMWIGEMLKKPEMPGKGKSKKDPYRLSTIDSELCEGISHSMACVVDKKTSEITISVTDQDPLVAAIMADTLQCRLQDYITDYRTKKARNDYEYYKRLMAETKAKYVKAQKAYAGYYDANMEPVLESVNSTRDQLENEMQLQYNAYNQMVVQAKAAEAKVQERTPAFTIIQHAYMPVKPSSTPKVAKVMVFIFLGAIFDAIWILAGRGLWQKRKKN